MLQASILLLILSTWFPGAARIGGADGSISFLLALFCALVSVASYSELARRLHRTEAALAIAVLTTSALIIVFSLLSMTYADDPIRTGRAIFAQVFGFATIPAVTAISVRPKGPEAVDRIVTAMIIMSVVTSCLVTIGLGGARFHDRAEGYFKHSNQLGIALSAGLPLVAARLTVSRRYRVLLVGCLMAVLLGLVKSGSKTNFVVGVAGLGVFFVLYSIYLIRRKKNPISIIVGIFASPILVFASLRTLQHFNPRAYSLLFDQLSGSDTHSMISRQILWSISINLGLAHPFLGVGAGQWIGDIAPHSHNLFIDYFRTLGVPGLALVTIIVLLVTAYLISAVLSTLIGNDKGEFATKTNVMVLGTSVSVWNYLVANQMSDSFGPSTAPFFWLPLALLMFYRGTQRPPQAAPAGNATRYTGTAWVAYEH
ncbi:O-antigen ligase family protein [Mesorhizobium sp. VK24D]|uniref:O-antigen ligase family protein n=1 Tax=Mesorhizobium album TaxID=3072314 RepID=A0ABU4Y5W8_9HYPH|nr:O-antigen ligase family protein [Mesorhizobium sp. VK24D]MDX8482340.1 O-antigen ligase family protein [Mesorhizobium sp. VK24D]